MITFTELLERAKSEKIVVHTLTEEQAITLLSELDKKRYKWFGGEKLTTKTFYENYEEKTCYSFYSRHNIAYGLLDWCQENDYTIVEFQDINFKEE